MEATYVESTPFSFQQQDTFPVDKKDSAFVDFPQCYSHHFYHKPWSRRPEQWHRKLKNAATYSHKEHNFDVNLMVKWKRTHI